MAKQNKGLQKVDLKALENENKRQIAFFKRRTGLFNKAAELNILTGAEVAAIVFSKPPGTNSLIDNFFISRNPSPPAAIGGQREAQCLAEALSCVKEKKERCKMRRMATLDGDTGGDGLGFWWDRPVENMEIGKVEGFKEALVKLRKKMAEKAEVMMMRETTPFMPPLNYGGTLVGFGDDQKIMVEEYLIDGGGGQADAV